jgi:hypothetical protein
MERKKALVLLSVVILIVVASSAVVTIGAASSEGWGNGGFAGWFSGMMMGPRGRLGGLQRGGGYYGFINVSEKYKANAINIAKNDPDVQNLLNDGYNVTGVRPVITTYIDAQGNVVTKATNAIVMLQKDTTGRASVWVDLEAGKVTRIVISTVTVIKKS